MRRIDIASALILLVASALVAGLTWHLPYWTEFAPGPAFASFWVAVAGVVVGFTLLAGAILRREDADPEWPDRVGARQVLLCAVLLALFPAALSTLGTVATGILFILTFLILVARRPLWPSVATAVATVGLIEAVFDYWLKIDMPKGVLGF